MIPPYKFGVIGRNINYSGSPQIFRILYERDNVEGSFRIYNLEPNELKDRFRDLIRDGVQGMSVTIPYKERVIPLLDEIDTVALELHAVNSVAVKDASIHGYNTDCFGFGYALREYADQLEGGSALVLGHGGAARAAMYSLNHDYRIRRFTVVGRNKIKLSHVTESVHRLLIDAAVDTLTFPELPTLPSRGHTIIVNGTPLGGWNHSEDSPLPRDFTWPTGSIYYDLNYNGGNKIVATAGANGLTAIDGRTMLIAQAIRSYQLWTGRHIEYESVAPVIAEALDA